MTVLNIKLMLNKMHLFISQGISETGDKPGILQCLLSGCAAGRNM